jgi:hypothetical protein
MSKYTRSTSDELESVALSGRKGGEAEAEVVETDEGQGAEGQEVQQPQSWKVLDREFKSPDELAAEVERSNKEILRMKQEQAEARKQSETQARQVDDDDDNSGNLSKAQIAKRLQDEYGMLTKEQAMEMAREIAREESQKNISVKKVIDNVTNFVAKHDGTDGKPKAEFEKLLETMDKHNFTDPQQAYKFMHSEELAEAAAKELLEKRPHGRISSERTSSVRTAEDSKPVNYNDADARAARQQAIIDRYR